MNLLIGMNFQERILLRASENERKFCICLRDNICPNGVMTVASHLHRKLDHLLLIGRKFSQTGKEQLRGVAKPGYRNIFKEGENHWHEKWGDMRVFSPGLQRVLGSFPETQFNS